MWENVFKRRSNLQSLYWNSIGNCCRYYVNQCKKKKLFLNQDAINWEESKKKNVNEKKKLCSLESKKPKIYIHLQTGFSFFFFCLIQVFWSLQSLINIPLATFHFIPFSKVKKKKSILFSLYFIEIYSFGNRRTCQRLHPESKQNLELWIMFCHTFDVSE